jgi:hypothetical protein
MSLAVLAATASDVAAQCAMARLQGGGPQPAPVFAATDGLAALYVRSDLDVNTDGTARSYHPMDPHGGSRAFNNMANAITRLVYPSGQEETCKPRRGECYMRFIRAFEAARDANWDMRGTARIETRWIIPWRHDPALGRAVPCTIRDGRFAGYFVSQTSRAFDPARDECDQARYIDSFGLNGVVIPQDARWQSRGVVLDEFDLVAVRSRETGAIRYAIVGDRGPNGKMGEGTIALAASLRDRTLSGSEPYAEIRKLQLGDVDYVFFPTFDARRREPGPVTQEKIDRLGAEAFRQWGGTGRLEACATTAPPPAPR